jgi:hypothetical protein
VHQQLVRNFFSTRIVNQSSFCSEVTTIRAIGKRAHPLHSQMFFLFMSTVVSIVG